jgi:hypothetical protein
MNAMPINKEKMQQRATLLLVRTEKKTPYAYAMLLNKYPPLILISISE